MAALILIALAQLIVSVLLLAVVLQQVTRQEIERATRGQTIRGLGNQTIRDMFRAAEDDGRWSSSRGTSGTSQRRPVDSPTRRPPPRP